MRTVDSGAPQRFSEMGEQLTPEFMDWFSRPDGQAEVQVLNDALEGHGETIFGVSARNSEEVMTVIVDAAAVGQVDSVRSTVDALELGFETEVVVSCYSRSALQEVEHALREDEWSSAVHGNVRFVDPLSGRLVMVVSYPTERRLADLSSRLEAAFGGRVMVVAGGAEPVIDAGTRLSDTNPHWGAAGIRPPSSGRTHECTANATIVGIYGFRFMPTAGHCAYFHGATWRSGTHAYGTEPVVQPSFPEYDITLLAPPSSETYTNRIHITNFGAFNTVTGQGNPGMNETICMTGATSGANCVFWVVVTDGSATNPWHPSGPTMHLNVAWTDINNIQCQGGDSGAPYYRTPFPGQAHILGIHHGSIPIPEWGVRACFYHDGAAVSQFGNYLTAP